MGDFPTSGLRAVRNALYVLSMTYMPSVALYVVESTFKGRFDPHYPPNLPDPLAARRP
jgi:hypothetical protein